MKRKEYEELIASAQMPEGHAFIGLLPLSAIFYFQGSPHRKRPVTLNRQRNTFTACALEDAQGNEKWANGNIIVQVIRQESTQEEWECEKVIWALQKQKKPSSAG
jgi:hypothetical protein